MPYLVNFWMEKYSNNPFTFLSTHCNYIKHISGIEFCVRNVFEDEGSHVGFQNLNINLKIWLTPIQKDTIHIDKKNIKTIKD